jgi:hypothetical protein
MLVTPDREQTVFRSISRPARREMLDLLVEADRSVNTITGQFQAGFQPCPSTSASCVMPVS